MLAFYQAASAEVRSHGAEQIVIANPGVVPAKQLAQLVNTLRLHPDPPLPRACSHHLCQLACSGRLLKARASHAGGCGADL